MLNRSLCLLLLACFSFFLSSGQDTTRSVLVDQHYQPIPFYKIKTSTGFVLTNSLGEFWQRHTKGDSAKTTFKDTVRIVDYALTTKLSFTKYEDLEHIKSLCKNSKNINLKSLAPFKYQAYNKFYIGSRELTSGVNWFNEQVLSKFKYKVKQSDSTRHLILSESLSEREYIDPLNEIEVVKWSKLSGIDKPLFLSLNSQLQTTDIYDQNIKILNAKYVNPFNRMAVLGYHYSFTDTVVVNGLELIKINYHPKRFSRFESIKGFAWFSPADNAILYLYAEPYQLRKMKSSYAIEFKKENEKIIPSIVKTTLVLDNVSSSNITITANQITYITEFSTDVEIKKSKFSDLALTYNDPMLKHANTPVPLTATDSNTYDYYAGGKNVKINSALKWGENLYFGKVYTKYASVNLPELITYNRYEKLRLGLSVSSNERLSKMIELNGRFAYGFGDKRWKYASGFKITALDNHRLELGASYADDLIEAGGLEQNITERFNNSEILRQFQLQFFDRQERINFYAQSRPLLYLTTLFSVNLFKDTPQYNYTYKGASTFKVNELNLSLRYAFGERYFRIYDERISFKSKYPIVWLHVDQSFGNSSITYSRLQLRARYTKDFIINGTSKIELIAGNYSGELPYFKLFNGLGSAELRSTIRGAFETMNYNEFTADKYAVLFYSHDFGYFNFTKNRTFRPRIETAINYGIGKLSRPNNHEGLDLKGFEKGYAEAGLVINDLILFYPGGIKIGVGVSFYHRLSYRYPTFGENSILKLSLGFIV